MVRSSSSALRVVPASKGTAGRQAAAPDADDASTWVTSLVEAALRLAEQPVQIQTALLRQHFDNKAASMPAERLAQTFAVARQEAARAAGKAQRDRSADVFQGWVDSGLLLDGPAFLQRMAWTKQALSKALAAR